MNNILVTVSAVIACCLLRLVGGDAFAADSRTDTTPVQKILTLDDALSRTLSTNAELAAFGHEVAAREAEAFQAGLLPNPELSLEAENIADSGDYSGLDSAESTVRLSQLVELGGKRKLRRELGDRDHRSARNEYEILRNELLSRTVKQFYDVLSAQERLALAGEQIELASRILAAVEQRVQSGKSPAVEIVRFKSTLAEARIGQETARRELAAARAALSAFWGDDPPDFEAVAGDLQSLPPLPQWAELEQQIGNTPSSALSSSASAVAEQAAELADAGRIPDITVSLGFKNMQETRDNAAVAEISIPLPLFDRNQGEIRSARSRLAKAREEERRTRREVRGALAEAFHRLHGVGQEAAALRDEILPSEKSAFDAVSYGYRSGKFGFLEVFDAEQSLFAARSRYIDVLTAYHQLHAEMEKVLGLKQRPVPAVHTKGKK